MPSVYTQAEVDKHNVKGDLWMTIHGKVYDVSTFAEDHPGGEEAIYEEAGKDATESFEDIGHSDEARELLEKFYIGDLDTAGAPKPAPVPVTRISEEKPKSGSALRVIVPAIIVAGILLYKFVLVPKKN